MRTLALALLSAAALSSAACAECGEDEGRCDGTVTQVCQDEQWVDVLDCADEGLACEESCVAGQPCCR